MRQFPFTDYDFWGYISSGFVFLFALDHVLATRLLVRPAWTTVEIVLAVSCAYVAGHLLAGLASALLERRVVGKWLGKPTRILFGEQAGPRWFRRLYPSYYEQLPEHVCQLALRKAAGRGIDAPGEALFWHAFEHARNSKKTMERMDTFLNLYGLCRNLSFTAFTAAFMLAVAAGWSGRHLDYGWALAAAVGSVGMFFRYLKFYRHYAVEMFTSFAHANTQG